MKEICSVYLVKESLKGAPSCYLGNAYKKNNKNRWWIGLKTYLTEAIRRIEEMFGKSFMKKDTPMMDSDHLEEDTSEILADGDHQKYMMLIGMLNWIICLERMDVAFAVTSLPRFSACPRKGHLSRLMRIFGYLKKCKNRRIIVDSNDPIVIGGKDALKLNLQDLLKSQ